MLAESLKKILKNKFWLIFKNELNISYACIFHHIKKSLKIFLIHQLKWQAQTMTKSCQYVKQSLLLKQHAYVTLINVMLTSAIKNYLKEFLLSHAWLMSRLTSASTTIKNWSIPYDRCCFNSFTNFLLYNRLSRSPRRAIKNIIT